MTASCNAVTAAAEHAHGRYSTRHRAQAWHASGARVEKTWAPLVSDVCRQTVMFSACGPFWP
ncbi:hypothetical protein, partial [Streptomyces sp. SID3343]|uniref:hypothetical protein n=1 Tax=Streptomyces sp. SID3343 TaxID=2690260 RepID=UPI001F16B56C